MKLVRQGLTMFLASMILGCSSGTHQLIEKARTTGDGTLVKSRFDSIDGREQQRMMPCPRGAKQLCIGSRSPESCSCMKDSDFREMFGPMRR